MASKPKPLNPGEERLTLHERPTANLSLMETQLPLDEHGTKIERYTTGHGVVFERHTFPGGAQFWFKLERGREVPK